MNAFVEFYWSDVWPAYIEPRMETRHNSTHLGVLSRVCCIHRKTSRFWFGFDGRWSLPDASSIQTMAVRLDMSEDDADQLWSAWLCAVRDREEQTYERRAKRAQETT